jgi:hypothetical protein
VLGPEYWTALRHTTDFKLFAQTPEQGFATLIEALEEGEWNGPWAPGEIITLPWLDPEVLTRKGFILISESPATIASWLDDAAAKDKERPWLRQWATGVRGFPLDYEMRARALLNLPDSRVIDPDGPFGCIPCEANRWLFFGFMPIDEEIDDDDDDYDYDDGFEG